MYNALHKNHLIKLTPGVRKVDGFYSLPESGIFVPSNHPNLRSELLDAGLASEISSPWWKSRSRATILNKNILEGTFQSIIYNTRGMFRAFFILGVFSLSSILLGNTGFLGICTGIFLFMSSILLHEAGHVFMFRMVAPEKKAVIVSCGLRCHMVRPVLPKKKEVMVVLSGPIAPFLLLPAFIILTGSVNIFTFFWAIISFGHIFSLAFPVGDGINLRLAFHS